MDEEKIEGSGESKFKIWLDANYERLYNGGEAEIEDIAREAWNQCADEASLIARTNRIKEREGKLENAQDFTIGQMIQLKQKGK